MKRPTAKPATLNDLIRQTERLLRAARLSYGHGTLNARDEAAWLISHAAKLRPDELGDQMLRPATARETRHVATLTRRRIETRKPLAYLLGEAWLCGYRFIVDQRVIVPRSFIAEPLLECFSPWIARPGSVKRILDLCTGSGCLAILAAIAFPKAQVDAVDISKRALTLARKNVKAHGLGRRVRLIESDLYRSLGKQKYDLIISNPPYVDARAMSRLPEEYRREPALALAGGKEGLDLVDRILRGSSNHMNNKGNMVIEIGHNRRAFERRYRELNVTWLEVGDGTNPLVWLESGSLARA